MPRSATRTPTTASAPDRLLTPLGGLGLAVVVCLLAFWVPLISLLH